MNAVALGDVVSVRGGGTPRKSNPDYYGGDVPWVTPKDMKRSVIGDSLVTLTDAGVRNSPAKVVPAGSVLVVVRSGVLKHTLPVARAARPVTLNQDMKALIPEQSAIDSSYLARLVKALEPTVLTWVRATTADNFPIDKLLQTDVLLPSLREQRRIAAILDHADALRAKRRDVLGRTGALSQAVLQQLLHEGFGRVALGDLMVDGPKNGLYRPSSEYGSGTPIVRIDSFKFGSSDIAVRSLKRLRLSAREVTEFGLRPGDLLVNRVNSREHVGKTALVGELVEPTVFESNMMRIRVDEERLLPVFVAEFMQTSDVRRQVAPMTKDAVNQSSINQSDVRRITIPLPPLEQQRIFTARVAKFKAYRAVTQRALAAEDELFAALQSRAFRGEL